MKKRLILAFCLCLADCVLAAPTPAEAFGEGCAVYCTSSQSVPNGAWIAIAFDAERWDDSLQCHAASGTAMSVAEGYAGWYAISGCLRFSSNATGKRCVHILYDGSFPIAQNCAAPGSNTALDVCLSTLYFLNVGDWVELRAYQNSGTSLNVEVESANSPEFRMVRVGPGAHPAFNGVQGLPGVLATPQPVVAHTISGPQHTGDLAYSQLDSLIGTGANRIAAGSHAGQHQDGGADEINVNGLSGILIDTQDAGWFQGLAITTTGLADGQVLAWNVSAEEWQPETVSGTGGLMDIITATISGTVPVVITNTYHYTEALSSGHDIAIIRSFTYGEASIAITLFVVAAMLGLNFILSLQRR